MSFLMIVIIIAAELVLDVNTPTGILIVLLYNDDEAKNIRSITPSDVFSNRSDRKSGSE